MKNIVSRVAVDFIYSLTGFVVMNAVLQFALYPQLKSQLGADYFGQILYVISILSIFSISFGSAADNSRLILRKETPTSNGDYNLSILIFSVVSIGFSYPLLLWVTPEENMWLVELLLVLTLLRYYSGVQFRMNLDYRGYLFYYLSISTGYIVGLALFLLGANWIIAFLIGELFAFVYVLIFGEIYRGPYFVLSNFIRCFTSISQLSLANLLNNSVQNLDRVLLIFLIGAVANSQYYIVSLLGKTLALIIVPVNSIMIGYLTKGKQIIHFADFLKLLSAIFFIGVFALLGCIYFTPIFLNFFYPGMLSGVQDFIFLASLGQIFCFTSSILLTILMTMASEKWQIGIQTIYVLVFLILTVELSLRNGLMGFVWGVMLANLIRFIIVLGINSIIILRKENCRV